MNKNTNNRPVFLKDIWPIENQYDYKIHFARSNGYEYPLDVWVKDKNDWKNWQEYRAGRNDFNREFIFSLMQFHHETDTWLFGGVWQVLARHDNCYEVGLTNQGKSFIGRLKLFSPYRDRTTRVNFEHHYADFHVQEILRESYSGEVFPGHENIDLSFDELAGVIRNDRPDWKAALQHLQGVYLITDTKTNRRYVGSASGNSGIWSRWGDYVESGHGGNSGLKNLLKKDKGLEYCRANFRFTLLEYHSEHTLVKFVNGREQFWKRILLTQSEFGYNEN